MLHAVLAALALASVMTLGDFAWAALGIRHRALYGVIHGAGVCLALGLAIGIRVRRPAPAAVAGPLIGVTAAAAFYLLAPKLGWGAMFPAWMLLWMLFAFLQRWMRKRESIARAALRGAVAAVLSGIALYLISDLWVQQSRHASMAVHFAVWSFAFLPGFAAVFWVQR